MRLLSNRGQDIASQPALLLATNPQALEISTPPTPSLTLGQPPPFYFSIPRQGARGGALGGLGLRKKEAAVWPDRRTPCLLAVGGGDMVACFLASQPTMGVWKSSPLHPVLPPVPRGSLPRIVPGAHKRDFVFLRQRTRSSPPTWPAAGPPCPSLGLRGDGAISQQGKLRSRDAQVCRARGGICLPLRGWGCSREAGTGKVKALWGERKCIIIRPISQERGQFPSLQGNRVLLNPESVF